MSDASIGSPLDLVSARFRAYHDAISRLRWFIMITVLLSSLVIFHVYLEMFGFQQAQLIGVKAHRIATQHEEKRACLAALVALPKFPPALPTQCGTLPPTYTERLAKHSREELLGQHARLEFITKRTENTLNTMAFEQRELPLLSLKVPINDFVPIISMLLVTFTIGVWLNLRSVLASLTELSKCERPEVMRLAQLHFTFTVPLDSGRQHLFLQIVAFLAFWLPFLSMLFAIGIDTWPVFERMFAPSPSEGYLGPIHAIAFRMGLMLFCAFVVLGTVVANSALATSIDAKMK